MSDEVEDFLAHYGVKGMRWGVRRSDDEISKSKSEKQEDKLQKKKDKAVVLRRGAAEHAKIIKEMDELGLDSPYMRDLYGRAADQSDRMFLITHMESKKSAVKRLRQPIDDKRKKLEKDAEALEAGKMTPTQKKMIAGAVLATGVLVAYGAYKYPDIVTRNAKAGENISYNNFMKRYSNRAEKWGTTSLTKAMFDKLDDTDVSVPAGTTFRRMTAFADESLGGRLYTTHTSADNDKYQGLYGPMLKMRTGAKQLYINEYEMATSIKSPSHKKRVQALIDILDEGGKLEHNGVSFEPRTWLEAVGGMAAALDRSNDTLSNQDLALKKYNLFAREIVGENPIGARYFDKIKQMGYNALVDDNDAGQLSDLPMILLDAANTTKGRKSTPLTPMMEKEARKRLTEVLKPV